MLALGTTTFLQPRWKYNVMTDSKNLTLTSPFRGSQRSSQNSTAIYTSRTVPREDDSCRVIIGPISHVKFYDNRIV